MPREYSVGYKKPPVEHQFKAGNSGGRKKATRKRQSTLGSATNSCRA